MPKFSDWLWGKEAKVRQATTMTPQQQAYQAQALKGAQEGLGPGMQYLMSILQDDPQTYSDFEAPMQRQFEQQVIPTIAERFAGMGSGGAVGSSGMNLAMAQAGREYSQDIAQLRAKLKSQALDQLRGLSDQGMQSQFTNIYEPAQAGAAQGIVTGLAQGAGMAMMPGAGMAGGGAMNILRGLGGGGGQQQGVNWQSTGSFLTR